MSVLDGGLLYHLPRRRDTDARLRCIGCDRPAPTAWTALRASGWRATDDGLHRFRCPACDREENR